MAYKKAKPTESQQQATAQASPKTAWKQTQPKVRRDKAKQTNINAGQTHKTQSKRALATHQAKQIQKLTSH